MEATKNVPSAHHNLKLMKEFSLVFGIYYKNSFDSGISKGKHGEGKYHKKQFALFHSVFNSYASTLIK